jgi:hypothetical protein
MLSSMCSGARIFIVACRRMTRLRHLYSAAKGLGFRLGHFVGRVYTPEDLPTKNKLFLVVRSSRRKESKDVPQDPGFKTRNLGTRAPQMTRFTSFVAERDERIDLCGATSGNVTGR